MSENLERGEPLAEVAGKLSGPEDPMEVAASVVTEFLDKEMVHVS